MNEQVLDFVKRSSLKGRIVDVGSYDVNGAVRKVVQIECGIDMREGPGVDKVMPAEDMSKHFSGLDAVTCCETMEHVEHWRPALQSIWNSIKVGGRLVLTVPHPSKGFHAHPSDYWRWEPDQMKAIFAHQNVRALDRKLGCSFGIDVVKVDDRLDLSIEPAPIAKGKPKVSTSKKNRRK